MRSAVALALAIAASTLVPRAAAARQWKLWPLFDYTSNAETGTRNLKLLGPLIEYDSDPNYRTVAFRPLFSVRQARVGRDDEVRVLYPLITARWKPEEQTTRSLFGVLNYRTTTSSDGKTLTGQHFRAVPFYFYDWDGEHGHRLSLPPLWADLDDVAGYEHVRMVAFPGYLRMSKPEYDRRFYGFPFYSEVSGPNADGYALWPAYGRMRVGDEYEGGFTAWPLYAWSTETRDGASTRERTAYGGVLWMHDVDRSRDVESFGFPWPVWGYERRISTGAPTLYRFQPLYEQRRVDDDVHTYRRHDVLVALLHNETDTDRATGKTAHLFALFPIIVDEGDGTWDRRGTPALLDAIVPRDTAVREMYAPVWRAYGWEGPVSDPRVSLLWDGVTREHGVTTGPFTFR